jgi:hypothetical protein
VVGGDELIRPSGCGAKAGRRRDGEEIRRAVMPRWSLGLSPPSVAPCPGARTQPRGLRAWGHVGPGDHGLRLSKLVPAYPWTCPGRLRRVRELGRTGIRDEALLAGMHPGTDPDALDALKRPGPRREPLLTGWARRQLTVQERRARDCWGPRRREPCVRRVCLGGPDASAAAQGSLARKVKMRSSPRGIDCAALSVTWYCKLPWRWRGSESP